MRWPRFMMRDLHPWFRGGRMVLDSLCPPPQVAEEWEEDEEEAGKPSAATCHHTPVLPPPSDGQDRRWFHTFASVSGMNVHCFLSSLSIWWEVCVKCVFIIACAPYVPASPSMCQFTVRHVSWENEAKHWVRTNCRDRLNWINPK